MNYIILNPNNGERECVTDLTGYDDWPVLVTFEGDLPEYHDVVDGELVILLDSYKSCKWNDVKALRTRKENATCTTSVGVVQIDEASKTKIMGILDKCRLCEESSVTFSEDFTLYDNTVVTLDNATIRQMCLDISNYISALYETGRLLREQIEAAVDKDALDAIDIESGWPSP